MNEVSNVDCNSQKKRFVRYVLHGRGLRQISVDISERPHLGFIDSLPAKCLDDR